VIGRYRWLWIRVALIPLAIFAASLISFFIFHIAAEDAFNPTCTATQYCPPDLIHQIREQFGWNDLWGVAYVDWIGDVTRWDLGRSTVNNRPVEESLRNRAESSLELGLFVIVTTTAIALAIHHLSSTARQPKLSDALAALLGALPPFALGIWFIILPFEWWGYQPPIGRYIRFADSPWGNVKQLAPAALALSMPLVPLAYRALRSSARTYPWGVAAAACVSGIGATAWLMVAEQTFTLPGVGDYFWRATYNHDHSTTMTVAFLLISICLILVVLTPLSNPATAPFDGDLNWRRIPLLVPAVLVIALIVVGILGSSIAPENGRHFAGAPDEGVSLDHWLGTDRLGRDVLSRLLEGATGTAALAGKAILFGFLPGLALGTVRLRYFGGRGTAALEMVARSVGALGLLIAFPVATLYHGLGWKSLAPYAVFAFLFGLSAPRFAPEDSRAGEWLGVCWRLNRYPAVAAACEAIAVTILLQSTVAFFGVVRAGDPTWGRDFAQSREFLPYQYLPQFAFGVAIIITLFAFNWLALSLRTAVEEVAAEAPPAHNLT
jgi:ABC-type dipeptide/oligopeptide/nickel transport system permease component/ABC-type antimicrobial peptide transport system permease subunit